MEPIVSLKNISKTFPGVKALSNVDLDIYEGEVHALVGENGAGKSTLMKILCGTYIPDNGSQILINNKKITFECSLDAMKAGISIIYQDISLFPNLTIAENIIFGNEKFYNKKFNWKEINKNAYEALKIVGLDNLDVKKQLGNFPIAIQQLVAIARAVNFKSKIIIMDEPTAALSNKEVEKLYLIIETLKKNGVGIIFISHKFDEIYKVSDRLTILRDGQYIGSYLTKDINENDLIKKMVGRTVQYTDLRGKKNIELNDLIFKVENLTKKGNFRNISFDLMRGEILGITGLVGSGRSELAKAIFGLNLPYEGKIYLNNQLINIKNVEDAIKYGLAYVPEDRRTEGLILEETLKENIILTYYDNVKKQNKLLDENKIQQISLGKVKELDIRPGIIEQKCYNFSGGNQQKIVIGKWLLSNPKVLIVDEPTNGVDIGAKTEIHKLLRNLADQGVGIIVISSELPEILSISDRVLVMRHGIVANILDNKNLTQEEIMNNSIKK
ncbi:MAG: sugar ABC transporter ATP-binding protein [Cetobacterium sp.]